MLCLLVYILRFAQKNLEFRKKIVYMVLFSAENGENGCFSDKISDISENTSYIQFNSVALGWKYYQNATLQPLNGLCSFNIKRVIADRISRKTQFFVKIYLFCWFFPYFSGTSGIIRKLLRLGDRAMKTLRNELLYDTVGQGVSEMRIF